ncbi:CRISPR-associated protein Cas4 [Clostridium chrysemydis]|uniref:CRISPR-associated protein Cas4 n=1 Tax=Clostridium chrysemydis TaxID=2665504 RepID=UPI003F40159C
MTYNFEDLKVQGVKFNYYFICKRKLWLYSNGITMENESERVSLGKLLHEKSYGYKGDRKEKLIDDTIKLDILDGDTVREVKITSSMKNSDKMQLLYYLYYLKQLGIKKKGTLNYVKEKKVEEVILDEKSERLIEDTLVNINEILKQSKPPKVLKLKYCKKCAYYEFCYVEEI